jgi:hypothetical protein
LIPSFANGLEIQAPSLPNTNMLHRLIVRFFSDRSDNRKTTWGRPAPEIDKKEWDPPLKLRHRN